MCWTDERHSRSSGKMKRSSGRTQVVFVLPRCSGILVYSSQENQQDLEKLKIQPEEFTDWIIFMSMFNDTEWKNTNDENYVSNAEKVKNYAMRFPQGDWTFLGPRSEEKRYGSSSHAQKGQ